MGYRKSHLAKQNAHPLAKMATSIIKRILTLSVKKCYSVTGNSFMFKTADKSYVLKHKA
jgi:hypothetical protein